MKYEILSLAQAHAATASALIHESFLAHLTDDWTPTAQTAFLARTSPESLAKKFGEMTFAAGAFCAGEIVGVVLMPKPTLLGLLFVEPCWLRRGVGKALWESVRTHIKASYPDVETIELNATPTAFPFYQSLGFVPISRDFVRDGQRAIRMACWLPAHALGADLCVTQVPVDYK